MKSASVRAPAAPEFFLSGGTYAHRISRMLVVVCINDKARYPTDTTEKYNGT